MNGNQRCVFITGGTGYMGRKLIPRLLERGHMVRALVRPGSERKLPTGCTPVFGNALDGASYADQIGPSATFVQLVGVVHPSPAKAAEFRQVDLPAGLASVAAAKAAGIRHFVYLSVAHPAPMMHDYIAVRMECEAAIEAAGLNATILRPWYVLGSGPSVALCLSAHVQAGRTAASNSRWCAPVGSGDLRTNDRCTNGRRGESCRRKTRCHRTGNSVQHTLEKPRPSRHWRW